MTILSLPTLLEMSQLPLHYSPHIFVTSAFSCSSIHFIPAQLSHHPSQPVKLELNKKLDPEQKTIQAFNIDA